MPKKVKIGIIVCVLLVLGIAGFGIYQHLHTKPKFITEVDRHLSLETQSAYQSRITDNQNKLKSTSDNNVKFDLYSKLGFDEYAMGHLGKSAEYFQDAININRDQYGVFEGLFQTQAEMHDYADAETSIKRALEIRPASADLWKKYIQMKIDTHASDGEITALFADALKATNTQLLNYTDMLTFYAKYMETTGNLEAAKEYWQKAAQVNPDSKATYQKEIDRLTKLMGGK